MSTSFQRRLATIAQQQFDKYHLLRENQNPLSGQIRLYWENIGLQFPGVETAWSAVFISWCIKKAGASPAQFGFAASHSRFFFQAIANASAGSGAFMGRELSDYAPKVGDILQNNRSGNIFDFSYAKTHRAYESHSAIVVEVGSDTKGKYLRTIGGNESDTVEMKEVRLNSVGKVLNPSNLYISAIESLL